MKGGDATHHARMSRTRLGLQRQVGRPDSLASSPGPESVCVRVASSEDDSHALLFREFPRSPPLMSAGRLCMLCPVERVCLAFVRVGSVHVSSRALEGG